MIGLLGARGIPRHAFPNQAVRQERERGSSRRAVLEPESSTTQATCLWLSGTSAIALGRMSDAIGYLLGLVFEAWMHLDVNEDSFAAITDHRETISANRRGFIPPRVNGCKRAHGDSCSLVSSRVADVEDDPHCIRCGLGMFVGQRQYTTNSHRTVRISGIEKTHHHQA